MTPEEHARRRKLEDDVRLSKSLIAKRVWNSASGMEFNDHYTVLARTLSVRGCAGVNALVQKGVAEYRRIVPEGKSIPEYLDLAKQAVEKKEFVEAKEILHRILSLDPRNAEAHVQLAVLNWEQNVPKGAVMAMRQAVALQPNSMQYRMRLAELWRLVGRPDYAQREIEEALKLSPNDPQIMTALGMAAGRSTAWWPKASALPRGRVNRPRVARTSVRHRPDSAGSGRRDEARAAFDAALAIDRTSLPPVNRWSSCSRQ